MAILQSASRLHSPCAWPASGPIALRLRGEARDQTIETVGVLLNLAILPTVVVGNFRVFLD